MLDGVHRYSLYKDYELWRVIACKVAGVGFLTWIKGLRLIGNRKSWTGDGSCWIPPRKARTGTHAVDPDANCTRCFVTSGPAGIRPQGME